MSFKSKFILVILSASLALYAIIGGLLSTRAQQQNDPGAQLRIFESVLQHIQHDYVDEPDLEKVRAGALRGLADGLDPYSTYLTPEQVANYQKKDANQVGIGAELSQVQSFLYVVSAVKGSPADLAGIRAGDTIEYIDSKATRDISLYDAYQLLNGAPGSEVKLRVIRVPRPLTISVRRNAFTPASPESRIDVGKIGVIRVNNLVEGTVSELQRHIEDLTKQDCQKIVLDLRGVAGGSLNEAVKVVNFFIKDGVIAKTIGRENKVINTFAADPQKKIFDGEVVVIIDSSTAGSGEVIASALIENKRGSVVGERSFGAGTEQALFKLRDGDGLLLTTVKWASGSGKPFLGAGVTPSVEVKSPSIAQIEDPEDLSPDGQSNNEKTLSNSNEVNPPANIKKGAVAPPQPKDDPQLKKAIELLSKTPLQKAA